MSIKNFVLPAPLKSLSTVPEDFWQLLVMESSVLSRLLQDSRLPDSYASFRVLVRLEREMALNSLDKIQVNPTMNLPTSPSAPGPLNALQTAAPAFRRTMSTPLEIRRTASTPTAPLARSPTRHGSSRQPFNPWGSQELISISRTPSSDSERTAPAEATSSKPQRTLVSHAMVEQLFGHLRAGHWEEADHMLTVAGHPPLPVARVCIPL